MAKGIRAFAAAAVLFVFVSGHGVAQAALAFDPSGGYQGQITCDEFLGGVNHHSVNTVSNVCIVAVPEGNFVRAYMFDVPQGDSEIALWHIGYWIPDSKEPAKKGQLGLEDLLYQRSPRPLDLIGTLRGTVELKGATAEFHGTEFAIPHSGLPPATTSLSPAFVATCQFDFKRMSNVGCGITEGP